MVLCYRSVEPKREVEGAYACYRRVDLQESTMQRRVTETRAFLNNLPKGPGALCTNAGRLSKPHEEFADKRSAASGPPRSGVTRSVAF